MMFFLNPYFSVLHITTKFIGTKTARKVSIQELTIIGDVLKMSIRISDIVLNPIIANPDPTRFTQKIRSITHLRG
jgi:hypothetical protein